MIRADFQSRDYPERRTSRWIAGVSLAVLILLAWDPARVLLSSNQPSDVIVPVMGSLVVSALMLVFAVASERFSMAQASTAAWIFVFLGMTAAYQVAQGRYPWLGQFDSDLVSKSAWVSLVGTLSIAVISNVNRLPFAPHWNGRPPIERLSDNHAIKTWLQILVALQVIATMVFVAYVGVGGITHGKTAFKEALAEASIRPGLGTAFFLATGLGIVLPATVIWSRRSVGIGSKKLLGLSLATAFVATNPLIGSRFLLGSFGVAVVTAIMTTSRWRRAVPILAVVGILFVFPSLDLWRGDGTGATSFQVQSPRTTLATGDFDGVEMLTRGIQVHDSMPVAQQRPLTQLGSSVFYYVPFAARLFPKIGSGAVVAQATGMKFTNVSMPIQGEGYLLAGWLGTIAACGLLALWLRRLKNWYPYSHKQFVGPTDAATAGLVFIVLRGSILTVLDYLLLAVVVAWLLKPGSLPSRIKGVIASGSRMPGRPRTIAFFLPQFHAIPENDAWWGEGFTDWTNTRRARSIFRGHDHPKAPEDDRHFDLNDAGELRYQAEQAGQYGIDAFCMYFYWFDGHRLLERPLDLYKDMHDALPFCVSWANENWTRRWDGNDREVLIAQNYTSDTPAEVYQSLREYFLAPHYLKVKGRPVLVVHRTDLLPQPRDYVEVWNRLACEDGFPGLHLVAAETRTGIDPRSWDFDAVAEFPPVTRNVLSNAVLLPPTDLHKDFSGRLMSYAKVARNSLRRPEPNFTRYRGVMPAWDNTARRGTASTIYLGHSPERYERWLSGAIQKETATRGDQGFVFINAWNEWAEGAYLQPDKTHGTRYLEATARAVGQAPHLPTSGAQPQAANHKKSWWPHRSHLRSLINATGSSGLGIARRVRARFSRSIHRPET